MDTSKVINYLCGIFKRKDWTFQEKAEFLYENFKKHKTMRLILHNFQNYALYSYGFRKGNYKLSLIVLQVIIRYKCLINDLSLDPDYYKKLIDKKNEKKVKYLLAKKILANINEDNKFHNLPKDIAISIIINLIDITKKLVPYSLNTDRFSFSFNLKPGEEPNNNYDNYNSYFFIDYDNSGGIFYKYVGNNVKKELSEKNISFDYNNDNQIDSIRLKTESLTRRYKEESWYYKVKNISETILKNYGLPDDDIILIPDTIEYIIYYGERDDPYGYNTIIKTFLYDKFNRITKITENSTIRHADDMDMRINTLTAVNDEDMVYYGSKEYEFNYEDSEENKEEM